MPSKFFEEVINQMQSNDPLLTDYRNDVIGELHAEKIATALVNNTTLTSLHLNKNQIGDVGAEKIAAALQNNTTLTSLNLEMNEIGEAGAEKIAAALQNNKTLTSLNLAWNEIGHVGAGHIVTTLQNNNTIKSLDLSGDQIRKAGAEKIASALLNNTTLTSLNLSSNNLRKAGAEKIASALLNNTTLTSLNLSSNNLREAGAEKIASALPNNATLTSLDLSGNQIRKVGAEKIATALRKNNTIKILDLVWNQIGHVGAEHMATALQNNTTLTSLNLEDNQIGDIGAEHVATALQHNMTLTSLNLENNQIGDIGAEHVATALQHNTTLTLLDLEDDDSVNASIIKSIKALLERNQRIKIEKTSKQLLDTIEKMNTDEMNPTWEEHEQYFTQKIKEIDQQINALSKLDPHAVQLLHVKEAWYLKLSELADDQNPLVQRLLSDPLQIKWGYSPKLLERILLHYYAQEEKTQDDYKNILILCLNMPTTHLAIINSCLIHCAAVYFGLPKEEVFKRLQKEELNPEFNDEQNELFAKIQKKFFLSGKDPVNKKRPLEKYSLLSSNQKVDEGLTQTEKRVNQSQHVPCS